MVTTPARVPHSPVLSSVFAPRHGSFSLTDADAEALQEVEQLAERAHRTNASVPSSSASQPNAKGVIVVDNPTYEPAKRQVTPQDALDRIRRSPQDGTNNRRDKLWARASNMSQEEALESSRESAARLARVLLRALDDAGVPPSDDRRLAAECLLRSASVEHLGRVLAPRRRTLATQAVAPRLANVAVQHGAPAPWPADSMTPTTLAGVKAGFHESLRLLDSPMKAANHFAAMAPAPVADDAEAVAKAAAVTNAAAAAASVAGVFDARVFAALIAAFQDTRDRTFANARAQLDALRGHQKLRAHLAKTARSSSPARFEEKESLYDVLERSAETMGHLPPLHLEELLELFEASDVAPSRSSPSHSIESTSTLREESATAIVEHKRSRLRQIQSPHSTSSSKAVAVVSKAKATTRGTKAPKPSTATTSLSEAQLRALFDTIDKDGSGEINKRELIIALRKDASVCEALGLPAHIRQEDGTREMFERVFQSIDQSSDNLISWSEFLGHFMVAGAMRKDTGERAPEIADDDRALENAGDAGSSPRRALPVASSSKSSNKAVAVVSKAKATTRGTKAPKPSTATTSLSEAQLRALFDTIDKDGSGEINKRELIIALRKDASVCEALGLPAHIRQEDGTREMFERVFQSIDQSSDNLISWSEFLGHFMVAGAMRKDTGERAPEIADDDRALENAGDAGSSPRRALPVASSSKSSSKAVAVVSKAKATTRGTKAPKPSTATTSLSEAQLRALFDTIDKDGSGEINKRELIIALRKDASVCEALGLPAHIRQEDGTREMFERVFQSIDQSSDNLISWSEFLGHFMVAGAMRKDTGERAPEIADDDRALENAGDAGSSPRRALPVASSSKSSNKAVAVVSKAKATTRGTKAPKPSTATTSLSEAQLRALFDTIDKDGSGEINKRELIIALRKDASVCEALGLPAHIRQEDGTREMFERVFQSIDQSSDNLISWSEFLGHFMVAGAMRKDTGERAPEIADDDRALENAGDAGSSPRRALPNPMSAASPTASVPISLESKDSPSPIQLAEIDVSASSANDLRRAETAPAKVSLSIDTQDRVEKTSEHDVASAPASGGAASASDGARRRSFLWCCVKPV